MASRHLILRRTGSILLFIFLTILTQTGGLIYLLCLPLFLAFRRLIKIKFVYILFDIVLVTVIYFFLTFLFIPNLAEKYGRQSLPVNKKQNHTLQPLHASTYLLNRQYVTPQMYHTITEVSSKMEIIFPGTVVAYLDASFPFVKGFPLFPHLSHNDGKKLDLAFLYKSEDNIRLNKTAPSPIGYGSMEGPRTGEENYPEICREKNGIMYNFLDREFLRTKEGLKVDEERTKALIRLLNDHPSVTKIFLEPHLVHRWGLSNLHKIRFHGCHAVRHDDHIHFQVK